MRKTKNLEPKNQSVEEIEEGIISRHCWNCHGEVKVYTRIECDDGNQIRSLKRIGICQNKDCFRFKEMSKVENWKESKYEETIYIAVPNENDGYLPGLDIPRILDNCCGMTKETLA